MSLSGGYSFALSDSHALKQKTHTDSRQVSGHGSTASLLLIENIHVSNFIRSRMYTGDGDETPGSRTMVDYRGEQHWTAASTKKYNLW